MLAPCVIAQSDHICTIVQQIFRLIGGDAHHCGIFTVDHHKIRTGLSL